MQTPDPGAVRRSAPIRQATRIASTYAVVGFAWIALSDLIVDSWFPAAAVTTIQTYKGWAFVAITAVLVHLMSSRALAAQDRASRALAESEGRLRTYLQHAPMAIFVLNGSGRCLDANLRAAELVGCSIEELRTLSLPDVIPQDSRDDALVRAAFAELSTRGWIEGDYPLLRRDGRIRWLATHAVDLQDGQLLAFAFDVTERRAADEKLRQAATVYASTREGVVITDRDRKIIAANPAFTTITGYREDEVLGQEPNMLKSGMHDRDWYRDMWRSIQDAGYWQGEIWNRRKNGDIYPEWLTISAVRNAEGETVNYVGVFTDITRIKHSEAQLDHLAHSDALTGLANRLLLTSRLEHAIDRASRSGTRIAALCINLDHFKQVNDSEGFETGDDVLRAAAARINATKAAGDTLARLGADEFILVREDLTSVEPAATLARDLVDAFASPLPLSTGRTVHVSASIGISLYPDDGASPNALIQHAGAAVTHAKAAGRRTFMFHLPAMAEAARARFTLEAELRQAIDRREFALCYQPRVRLADGRIDGVEALIRWPRPGGTVRQPDDFLWVAETAGLISALGDWALAESSGQLRRWVDAGHRRIVMAVNVSPQQLADPEFASRALDVLSSTGVDPAWIEFEITESAALAGGNHEAQIRRLVDRGARIAIDDFGTGHSSLARLRQVPAHTLKIDKAFVQSATDDHGARGLVATIVALAGHLHLQTVAEGVETEQQAALLRQLGCAQAQGFLYGRPAPADELAARLLV